MPRLALIISPRQVLHRFTELVRRRGLPDALLEISSRIVATLTAGRCTLTRYYILSQPLENLARQSARGRRSSFEFRLVQADDPLLEHLPRPPAEIRQRFAAGSQCLLALSRDRVAGFVWFQHGAHFDHEVRARFVLPTGETTWDFDMYVAPAFRGGMAFLRLWEALGSHLAARGIRWSMSRVWAHNDDSISSHVRLGAYPVASALFLAGSKFALTIGHCRPRVQLSNSQGAEVLIALPPAARAARSYARFAARR